MLAGGGAFAAGTSPGSFIKSDSAPQGEAVVLPDKLTPEEVDGILAGLTDAQVRQLLSGQLRKTAEAQATQSKSGGGGFGVWLVMFRLQLERNADTLRMRAGQLATGLDMLPGAFVQSLNKVSGGRGFGGLMVQIASLIGILAAGLVAHWLVRRATRHKREEVETLESAGLGAKLGGAGLRAVYNIFAIAAFALVALGLSAVFFEAKGPDRTFVVTYVTGALIILGADLVSRFVLAPYAPSLRLVPLGSETACYLHRWILRLIAVATIAWLTAGLLILTGMPLEAHLIIVLLTGAIMAGMLIVMILQSRAKVAVVICGSREAAEDPPEAEAADTTTPPLRLREQFAETWHIFATLYVALVWVLWAMSMLARGPSTIWAATASVGVILLFPVLDRLVRGALLTFFGTADSDTAQQRAHYVSVVQRGVRIVLAVAAAVVLLQLWGVNLLGGSGAQAETLLLDASFDIAVAILLAYIGYQLIKVGIDRRLESRVVNGETIAPSARMMTLLPLFRKFIVCVLVIMTVMLVLSAIGVNIGPLLAGAGVVGIAIGFGAQSLVRDIMSGIFFLVEDAFRVGEYIEMGELRGEVEAISLRSLRLRHHRGALHTVPYGELRSITNHNRDWTIYKMNFRVPFETDIDKVKKIMKKVGKEMMEDADLGQRLLEPLKSQGVLEIDDSGMVIRVKFTCKPREQFVLRREAYKRIKAAFEENGIEFARRKVEVHAAGPTARAGQADISGAGAVAGAAAASEPSAAQ